jgi:CO dehydrogenase maturation factor
MLVSNDMERGFKVAVCGKGGVGKTLIAGTMARLLAKKGFRVLAIDVDSNPNLHTVLGIGQGVLLKPLAEDERLVEERTGARPGGWGSFFILNPKVDDIPDKYSLLSPEGARLLVIGMPKAGFGCMCPQNTLVKALVEHIVLERKDVVVLDLEAGLEHFGRGTARGVDYLLIVMEPTLKALETAKRSFLLAKELGIGRVWGVLNKVKSSDEEKYFIEKAHEFGLPVKISIPFDSNVEVTERLGVAVLDYSRESPFISAVDRLCQCIISDWYRGARL